MAEGTYEYECLRAELLGLKTPDREEFELNKAARMEALEDEMDTINLEDADAQNDQNNRIGGKLNELNTILKNTQRKIRHFKTYGFVTANVTNLFKLRKSSNGEIVKSTENIASSSSNETSDNAENIQNVDSESGGCPTNSKELEENRTSTPSNTPVKKSDLSNALDKHTDVLDRLLEQSENAQYSMRHQNKEMKRFLK